MSLESRGNVRTYSKRQPQAIGRHPSLTESLPLIVENRHSLNQTFIHKEDEQMANNNLQGKKVAILVTDGFEQSELLEPRKALDQAGATTKVVSPAGQKVRGWNHKEWGNDVAVDVALDSANADQFDALLLPGGVMNPDQLRMNPKAVEFVKRFTDSGKPVAAICHGPWTLVEADAVRGHTMTSWPSLKTDLKNAGANWVDKEVVSDRGLVTSRKPDDIPAFNREMIRLFAEASESQGLRKTA
jgi:protease I